MSAWMFIIWVPLWLLTLRTIWLAGKVFKLYDSQRGKEITDLIVKAREHLNELMWNPIYRQQGADITGQVMAARQSLDGALKCAGIFNPQAEPPQVKTPMTPPLKLPPQVTPEPRTKATPVKPEDVR